MQNGKDEDYVESGSEESGGAPAVAAWVGIDWADERHAMSLLAAEAGASVERGTLEQTPEAIAAWAEGLRARLHGRTVAVAVEQKRGALVAALAGILS